MAAAPGAADPRLNLVLHDIQDQLIKMKATMGTQQDMLTTLVKSERGTLRGSNSRSKGGGGPALPPVVEA